MQVKRYVNGKRAATLPKEIENAAVREVLAKAEGRMRRAQNG